MDQEEKIFKSAQETNNNNVVSLPAVLVEEGVTLFLPLQYTGGDLGLGNEGAPWIHFKDANGTSFLTHSIQWLLKNIDSFAEGRDREQSLSGAAIHYGLDVRALLGRDQLCNVCTPSDEVLLAGVSHEAASWACATYMERPESTIRLHIRFLGRYKPSTADSSHEGPLVLLHELPGVSSDKIIAIKSHVGICHVALEEASRRIEQFSRADQTALLAILASHYETNEYCGKPEIATRNPLSAVRYARLRKTRPTKAF